MSKVRDLRPIFEVQAAICQSLGHPVRLEILEHLSEDELSNQELIELLEIPKANVSLHVNVLKKSGLVEVRKEGVNIFVSLAMPKVKQACALVRSIIEEQAKMERNHQTKIENLLKRAK
jgi:ArsR family transcriptional regulator